MINTNADAGLPPRWQPRNPKRWPHREATVTRKANLAGHLNLRPTG